MKTLINIALFFAVLLIGVAMIYAMQWSIKNGDTPAEASSSKNPVNVHIRTITTNPIDDMLLLTGHMEAWEEVMLSAEVAGVVEWQGIEEGDIVTDKQELFRIDTTWHQAAYDQAIAENELARQELERFQELRKGGVSSSQDVDRAMAQQKVARAGLRAAKTQLDKSILYAPFDGVVETVTVKAGEWTDRGSPLMRLVQTHAMKVILGIPERDISCFKVGDTIEITLDALPGKAFKGEIFRIAISADRLSRTFRTEIKLENADGQLQPGMTIRARLVRQTFPDAIAVPIFTILSLENQRFVALEKEGLATIQPIQVGILQGNDVQVTEGLNVGDRLIVVGQRDLRPGDAVTVTEEVSE